MVGPLFTAFAMIATGRVELPPVAPHMPPPAQIRGILPEQTAKADRKRTPR